MNIRKIIKEEINDFDWVQDVEPLPFPNNTAFEITSPKPENSRVYNKLVSIFMEYGFQPIYDSPKEIPETYKVVGVAVYDDNQGNRKFVYTEDLFDGETYEEHITRYYRSQVGTEPKQVVNAEDFLRNYEKGN